MFNRRSTSPVAEPPATAQRPAAVQQPAPVEDEALDLVDLWSPGKQSARKSVEQLLLERGQINESHLVQARQVAAQTPGKSLAQILQSMQAASEAQILAALAETLNLSFETPEKSKVES